MAEVNMNKDNNSIKANFENICIQTVPPDDNTPENKTYNAKIKNIQSPSSTSSSESSTDVDDPQPGNTRGPSGSYPPQYGAYGQQGANQGPYAQYQQGQPPVIVVIQQQAPQPQKFSRQSSNSLFSNTNSFDDPNARKMFIQRTYIILSIDLLFMFGLTFFCSFYDPLKDYLTDDYLHYMIVFCPFFALALFAGLIRCCCVSLFAKPVLKWILHVMTVVGYGGLAALVAVTYEREVVLLAVGGTLAIIVSITALAFLLPCDFTRCYFVAILLLVLVFIAGICAAIILPNDLMKPVSFGIGIAGVAVFSLWFLIDTQSLMAGNSVSISPNQHVYAATELFVDIYTIFVCLLQVVGLSY